MNKKPDNSQNKLVKESIFTALMILMEKTNFKDISITDLCKKAGVSRMAYYRNYNFKEDVIIDYLDEMFEKYLKEILSYEKLDIYRNSILFFSYFRKHEKLILNLITSNLTYLIMERFDKYIYSIISNIVSGKKYPPEIEKYIIQYMAGGQYKVLISWAKDGMKESDEEMANITWRYIER